MIKIVTDSSSDFTKEELIELNIHVVPLSISIGEESFLDGVDISSEQFIEKMQWFKSLPKSSQPAAGEFLNLYNQLTKDGSEVLSIHMSGKLSGTVESARTAAGMADGKVTVVDSLFISKALGFQVREAAKMAKEGYSTEEITNVLNQIRKNTNLFVVVDTLENLVKGGRIGKGTALIGSFLNIKPIAILEDGEYSPVAKVRSQSQAIKYIVKQFMSDVKGKTVKYASVAHANGIDFALKLKEQIEEKAGYHSVEILWTSPVISTHTGQGAIGFSYYAE
ncbi:degV family protein [Bacillus freudenreichii]|nr:degV family protein [Bacillus freudenreichii]